ncbi:MAG TPA: DUF11 domain-containing protein [Thermoanaerobaculia bacterium]|nr:DUF11 domain-containing protein [Thermoanaerobaculia bacterium]
MTLSAVKTALPNPVLPGGIVDFTIVVANPGPATALGVTVSDALPPEMTFVSCSASPGVCNGLAGGVVTASLGTLAAGETGTVTISAQAPPAPATIANHALATASNGSGDPADSRVIVIVGSGGGGPPHDIPALDPRALVLLTALLVWFGVRALRGGA